MKRTQLLGFAVVTLGALAALSLHSHSRATAPAKKPAAMKPVESDMHEFMEYVHKPAYMRLRPLMAAKPNRSGWRKVKAESLLLAEAANLLLIRGPKENRQAWNGLAVHNRELGAKLYQAGKKRNFDDAKKHYTALIQNCNQCHTKFANGEHQLKP